mmetsp:Transcript_5078/g.12242  ORF Transcript_5078/g.12242 Transcript_5078/m.12242 type:complete len:268 (+) Transcript_5078:1485-2288(+)
MSRICLWTIMRFWPSCARYESSRRYMSSLFMLASVIPLPGETKLRRRTLPAVPCCCMLTFLMVDTWKGHGTPLMGTNKTCAASSTYSVDPEALLGKSSGPLYPETCDISLFSALPPPLSLWTLRRCSSTRSMASCLLRSSNCLRCDSFSSSVIFRVLSCPNFCSNRFLISSSVAAFLPSFFGAASSASSDTFHDSLPYFFDRPSVTTSYPSLVITTVSPISSAYFWLRGSFTLSSRFSKPIRRFSTIPGCSVCLFFSSSTSRFSRIS